MECFERGLELTSVNCGFCRRRVVGFARTKQYKVDEGMWQAIKSQCPFLDQATAEEMEPAVEFYDEDAPPLHNGGEGHSTAHSEASGEIKEYYEQQLRDHQSQVQAAEARALEQTIEFLQNDPEFTASLSPASSTSSSSSGAKPNPTRIHHGVKQKPKTTTIRTRTTKHKPVTRSVSNTEDAKQPKLDNFFGSSRASSRHSGSAHNLRSHSDAVGLESPRARSHLKVDGTSNKYFLRSASASPTKHKRKQHGKGRKALLQLTLETTISPIALHTRSRDLKRASSCDLEPSKMLTRQGRRRRSWKCAQCTFTNTCFDSRCSMCHSVPPPEAYSPLASE
ncbi:hypothetical protein PHYBOEH_003515 [Phytophthora boehmeriae]|uniref:RanBP2-type domain-containing protein n=1 Tax=Phytophthora boehmeriae TaxID=109152 RepID=A0A8T1X8R8_9STRA|nr:hypothetical protein PHYBOEH_003515 [Phytophthora boehmeriae]